MTNTTLRLTALSAALAGLPALGSAQSEEITALTKPQSEISIGIGYWSDDRPRWGTYGGMREEGAYGLLDALVNKRDDASGTWFRLDARNLGLDTREIRAEWFRQGDIGGFLEYNRIQRDEPHTVFTGVQGIGTTRQRVPTPSATAATRSEVDLNTVRDAWAAGVAKAFGGGYEFRVSFKNEDKEGSRLWGRGGAAEFAAEPIDSNIKQLEAVLAYTGKAFQVQGGYYGSWYTNNNNLVDTALTNGANPFFLSLPLDNEARQFFANGGYNLSEHTRASFKLSYTRATQDEAIPVGTGVPVFAGAPTHLNGRLDTTLMQVGLNSRATRDFSWLASLRSYESDEKTPQVRVVQTAATCGTCVDNTPLTFKTVTAKVEGTYRLAHGVSLTGGIDQSMQERNVPFGHANAAGLDAQRYVPFRADLDETTLRLEARRALAESLNGRVAYLHSKRDGSDFTAAAADAPQANLINPIHIADRDRDRIRLMLDWSPAEAFTLTFNVDHAQDDYGRSGSRPYGLHEGTAATYSLDATYAISESWRLSAWYTRDRTEATQVAQRNANGGAAEAVKTATLEDTGDTFGLGLSGILMPRLKAGVDLLYSKNVNRYPETLALSGAGTVYPASGGVSAIGPLPDIVNKLTRFTLYASYAVQKSSELRVDFIAERWETDDWTWLFANGTPFTYGTTTDGTQVVQAPKQNANFVGARYIYRFQ